MNTYEDNGGVHLQLRGIPNRAFLPRGVRPSTGSHGIKAGRIWYETLRDSALRPNTGFARVSCATDGLTAGQLCGPGKAVEQHIVADARGRRSACR